VPRTLADTRLRARQIDGEDSKYSCELHHSKYSWMGSAADGGYLGRDVLAFLSALLSAAAGEYVVSMDEDADIDTDVTIWPGMSVSVHGDNGLPDAPAWGRGSFTVGETALLELAYVKLDMAAVLTVRPGGSLTLMDMSLLAGQLDWTDEPGATLSLTRVAFDGPSLSIGNPCRDLYPPDWMGGPSCDRCPGGLQCEPGVDGRTLVCPPYGDYGVNIEPAGSSTASGVIDFWHDEGETYANLKQCRWTVSCPGAIFEFTHLDTDGGSDVITLPDGQELSGSIANALPEYRATGAQPGSTSTISFQALYGEGRGFRVRWRCPAGTQLSQTYTVGADGHSLTAATPGAKAFQCFLPYTPLFTEAWRAPTVYSDVRFHTDADSAGLYGSHVIVENIQLGNDRWFRMAGDAGDSLVTADPADQAARDARTMFCGSSSFGWLSGHDIADGEPDLSVRTPGHLPRQEDGPMPMVLCIDTHGWGDGGPCQESEIVAAVHCGEYLLWKLPSVEPDLAFAFCTQDSGIPGANDIATTGTDCGGGQWAECTAACELAEERVWEEDSPATGFGALCEKPLAPVCHVGDGDCTECRWESVEDQLLNGCETLSGFDFATHGFCRTSQGARVNGRVIDFGAPGTLAGLSSASVERCAQFCTELDGCNGISFSFDVKRRCFLYGPGLEAGLPPIPPGLYEAQPVPDWQGYPQSETAPVIGSNSGGQVLCAVRTAESMGR
jgi:hypothetical protein